VADKIALLLSINEEALKVSGASFCSSFMAIASEHKFFASTEGSYIEQERIDVVSRLAATAKRNGDMQQASISLGALIFRMSDARRGRTWSREPSIAERAVL
jgi:predicted Zn-dependent protease